MVVGEHSTQPTVSYVGHARPDSFVGYNFSCLMLGAYEEYLLATGSYACDVGQRLAEQRVGFLQVNDVDPILGTVDVRLHFGVPSPGLVPKVGAGFQHVSHTDVTRHSLSSSFASTPNPGIPRTRRSSGCAMNKYDTKTTEIGGTLHGASREYKKKNMRAFNGGAKALDRVGGRW